MAAAAKLPASSEAAANAAPGQVQLVESNARRVVLELTTPSLRSSQRAANGVQFLDLDADGAGKTAEVGKPQLPIYGVLLAIPQGAQAQVKILQDKLASETLALPVSPAPQTRAAQKSPDELPEFAGLEYIPDAAAYSSSELYPAERVSLGAPSQWRSQRYLRVQLNPFQYNAATRELTIHKKLRVEINFGLDANAAPEQTGRAVDEGGFEQILKQSLLNYASARAWRNPARRAVNLPQPERAATTPNSFRIEVNADGMFQVTCDALIGAGLDANNVNLDTLQLSFQGAQVALEVVEDGDKKCESGEYFLFFGQAPSDYTIPYNVYWLAFGGANGKRMASSSASGGAQPPTYTKTLHVEENNGYITFAPFVEAADHWIWRHINLNPGYYDIPLNLDDLAPGATTGTLRVLLQSGAQANPYWILQSTLYANDVQIHQENWTAGTSLLETAAVNNLTAGANTFRIQDLLYASTGILVDLNYLELDYPAQFIAANDALRFKYADNGTWQYRIQGFTNSNLAAYDITDPANVAKMNISASPNGGAFDGSFGDQINSQREYLALATSQFKTPSSIVQDTPSNLADPSNGADYIIIAPGDWLNNVQPLAAQRATMGRVKVIDVQDIYDEFNYGMKSASALRDFFEYAYANWQAPAPSYVLLVGSGNMDNGNGEPTFIPVYMKLVDPWIGMTASDHCLVALDSPRAQCQVYQTNRNPLPSMALGRLPALSKNDVNNMVAKLLAYENVSTTGGWRRKVMFVSDNAYDSNGYMDGAGNFFAYSEEVAGNPYYVPAPLTNNLERVYYNPCVNTNQYPQCAVGYATYSSSADARNAVIAGFKDGRLIVNYVGHGAIAQWAGENLLKYTDASTLVPTSGEPRYPFMLPMTCYDGYFHSGYSTSVSEAIVRQANGGAIGSFAPAGLGVASGHDYLDRGFFEALTQQGKVRVGLATVASKGYLFAQTGIGHADLFDTFNLLGDPGTLLNVPDNLMPPPTLTPMPTSTPTSAPTLTPTVTSTPTSAPTSTPVATVTPTATPGADACSVKPTKPELIAPQDQFTSSKRRVKLSWAAGACVTRYQVIIKLGSKTGRVIARPVIKNGATSYEIAKLPRGATYYWRVKACNANGCARSPWRTFQVK